jgi:hypothetical protein
MDRDDAKEIIAIHELKKLSNKDKLEILKNNYWFFGDKEGIVEAIENGDYPKISESFIELINVTPVPIFTEESEVLLIAYEKNRLIFVSNLYLQAQLEIIKSDFTTVVVGEEERAGLCPCCDYYSIGFGEDGLWDICSVCFWENGGDGPNHMLLEDAKVNFVKFGAIDESSLKFVDKEGNLKYKRLILNG